MRTTQERGAGVATRISHGSSAMWRLARPRWIAARAFAISYRGRMCCCCGGPTKYVFTTYDVNRGISDESFVYVRCQTCGTYSLANPPVDLDRYYPRSYYGALSEDAFPAADWRVRAQLAPVLARLAGGSIIEVGAHNGALLHESAKHGFERRVAIERDAVACAFMRTLGIDARETDDPVAGLGETPPADAVVMHHVLEHVTDPVGLLDIASRRVKPGGVMVVASPNPSSLSFRVCRGRWMHVDAPRHLHLVPLSMVRQRAVAAGLQPAAVTTRDAVSASWNEPAWNAWIRHVTRGDPRIGYWFGRAVRRSARPLERLAMRGSCYMATFVRPMSSESAEWTKV